jgi:hypothetical protein
MPDFDQIKQGEQVTTSALEGSAWRFAGIPSVGITDAVEVPVFLIWQLLHWLLFGCKNSQERPRATCRPVCEGALRQCYRPHPAVPPTEPHGLPSGCSAKFGEIESTTAEIWLAAQISK